MNGNKVMISMAVMAMMVVVGFAGMADAAEPTASIAGPDEAYILEDIQFYGEGSIGGEYASYMESVPFGCDNWMTSVPSQDAIVAEFTYGATTYPAIVAEDYGAGKAVFGTGMFSHNYMDPASERYKFMVNSIEWTTDYADPADVEILITYGHQELLSYTGGSNCIVLFEGLGYSVTVTKYVPTDLSAYDVVFMPGVGWAYGGRGDSGYWAWGGPVTTTEAASLYSFVEGGGGLVMGIEENRRVNFFQNMDQFGIDTQFISNAGGNAVRIQDHPVMSNRDAVSTSIVSYAWDFGNGDISTYMDPVYAYAVPGEYLVTLTVTDELGTTAVATHAITILGAEDKVEEICDTILELPDDAFSKNPDQKKNTFSNKLDEVLGMIAAGDIDDAKEKLENDIKPKCGEAKKPWIVDPVAQDALITMIEDLLAMLDTM